MSAPLISTAEQTAAARIGAVLFRHRGMLPVPFVLIPLLVPGEQTRLGWLLAALIIVAGEGCRLAGVSAAGTVTRRRSRHVQRLVTYGIFSWMRNPLYVGNFLVWIGFVVGSGVLWFLPIAAVLFALEYTFIVRYEEGVLESIFGEEYVAYKARTPRWLPRPPDTSSRGPHDFAEALRSEMSTFAQYAALAIAFYIRQRISH